MLPLGGNPLEFLDETYPAKTGGMGLGYFFTVRWKLHDPSFNRFWDIGGLKAENRQFCLPWPWNPGQGSLKVIDFGTNGMRVHIPISDQ